MPNYIDYDAVAELYDYYASASYDHDFFIRRIRTGEKVLELMAGTGRLSIPLVKAGAALTCVDLSEAMLRVLRRKLDKEKLGAEIHCADVQFLDFEAEFAVAILPFQSFMELVGRVKQMNTLQSVYRALLPNGRFFCTMHNPAIRRRTVDGILRGVGTFKYHRGSIVVTGFETGGDPVVKRSQFIECFDEAGNPDKRVYQSLEFELIDAASFRQKADETGFIVKAIYGDYSENEFDPQTSPVMIWELEKGGS